MNSRHCESTQDPLHCLEYKLEKNGHFLADVLIIISRDQILGQRVTFITSYLFNVRTKQTVTALWKRIAATRKGKQVFISRVKFKFVI